MIKYICRHCNDLETETSICPVCGTRTSLLASEIYYCKNCNSPSFSEECSECHSVCEKIGSDLRPVFAQERLLLEVLLDKPMAFAGKSVWCSASNTYWIDGKKLRVNMAELRKQDPAAISAKLQEYELQNSVYVRDDKREELKERWQIATITILNTGKLHCDFTYLDEGQDIEEYYQKWKKQYLK